VAVHFLYILKFPTSKVVYNTPGNTKGGSITVLLTSCLISSD